MRILFIADGRSPIALNWIRYFESHGDEVHLASTFVCMPEMELASISVIPVAFSQVKSSTPSPKRRGIWSGQLASARTRLRQWLGPFSVPAAGRRLAALIDRLQPDLLHAMRIPYEGMLAASAAVQMRGDKPPLIVSVWGNDFTLHAPSSPWMRNLTIRSLLAADALHTDCRRDLRLAQSWGWDPSKPSLVVPGAGGIQTGLFYPPADQAARSDPLVINPRGFRAYVRNDTFFKAAAAVLAISPEVRFICTGMSGEKQADQWATQLGISHAITLLPNVPHSQMADLFRQAQVAVSPSTHDGTPNTLLEAMACGCFPIAGDLESLREWITPGQNGLLVDPGNPQELAEAILRALREPFLRQQAQEINTLLAVERAAYERIMPKVTEFYQRLVDMAKKKD